MICATCRIAAQQQLSGAGRLLASASASAGAGARRCLSQRASSASASAPSPSMSISMTARAPRPTVRATRSPQHPLASHHVGGSLFFSSSAAPPTSSPDSPIPSSSSSAASPDAPAKPDFLDDAESVIWDRLSAAFAPVTALTVRDISGGCGSMYGIEICAEAFRGRGMLQQQRMVNGVLGDLMKGWHGVQLKTRAP